MRQRKLMPAIRRCAWLVLALLAPWVATTTVAADRGAVASASPAATAVGAKILSDGGNAADAAVATALALAVVMPQAGNLGGGGFAVTRFGSEVRTLDFRETAPAAATPEMYLDEQGAPRPGASLVGPLAAGVPGSPAGLHALHQALGRLPWVAVVAPAIELAQAGFTVDARLAQDVGRAADLLGRFPETAALWLPGGRPPAVGSRMRLPALAATLKAYAAQGPAAITAGPVATAIERAAQRHGGVLRAADLAAYRPRWRAPVRFSAFGWQVASMPLPSSGGIILGETSGLLGRHGWAVRPRDGADRLHLLVEAWRRAFADRVPLGDPATTRADAADLLAAAWLDRRAAEIDLAHATPSAQVALWSPAAASESRETTHLSVIDGDGNAVALTTTLNGSFGCGLRVPEAGFFLNNEMDDFATAPGRPNLYGLIQGEANAVRPGKRMLSSMSPTVAWRGDELIALGSPGGSRIPTATLQVLLALIVDGDTPAEAVARLRIHHQWRPDILYAEPAALAPQVAEELVRRGHEIRPVDSLGEVQVVRRLADGVLQAAADPRHPGAVVVLPSDGGG
ncbi:gamma-glutamyltranspeptidase [Thioflavicoccus mobilis 8321]|uniref:Glutathione hydrolase proenzyme n=1 Tax=Thioflavicoccus mobilis 8321 TaxID=765912 RepID=L0H143_9GAMM|nr:gamma-glutamyltransferase [Thioflavicoccus mobilis]AGA91304.1 gamma-glutamyltranspeptidase [Thioflavicoccus mobilis 8321]